MYEIMTKKMIWIELKKLAKQTTLAVADLWIEVKQIRNKYLLVMIKIDDFDD